MNDPIIALDFPNKYCVEKFLSFFPKNKKLYLKVGMELYYSEGVSIIYYLKSKGHKIFLDLKLHDIPNTVSKAMEVISNLDIDMVNIHAAGGKRMMEAALEGLEKNRKIKRPILIAVTQLTSISEEEMQKEQMIKISLEESVLHYANLAKLSNLDGVVCSAFEVRAIKKLLGDDFLTIVPGIRLKDMNNQDQRRFVTPQDAKKEGASYIVVGRYITKDKDPFKSYKKVKDEWEGNNLYDR